MSVCEENLSGTLVVWYISSGYDCSGANVNSMVHLVGYMQVNVNLMMPSGKSLNAIFFSLSLYCIFPSFLCWRPGVALIQSVDVLLLLLKLMHVCV